LPVVPPSTGPIVVAWQPPARGRGGLIAVLVVVVLLAAGGAGWFVWQGMTGDPTTTAEKGAAGKLDELPGGAAGGGAADQPADDDGATPDPADESGTAPTDESSPPSAPADAETAALVELDRLRNASLAGLTLDGRWVAQVASKYVGIADPLQEAPNGGHTFYAADILAEHLAVQGRVSGPVDVLLLAGTDFGRRSTGPEGQQFWITLVDGGFGGESDVEAWCAATYPELTPEQRENTCAPRTLAPPHD
jgi:hypothetical protein